MDQMAAQFVARGLYHEPSILIDSITNQGVAPSLQQMNQSGNSSFT
jgi:hypothetical protein